MPFTFASKLVLGSSKLTFGLYVKFVFNASVEYGFCDDVAWLSPAKGVFRRSWRNERFFRGAGGEGGAWGGVMYWSVGVGSGAVVVEERLELRLMSSQPLFCGLRD